ncbi:MAG: hypothetical protein ACTSRP_09250 [Candidatus Helarchaeota archaeon]
MVKKIKILRLLFEFHSEYTGYIYISGNAFRHALSKPIYTSIGIFTDVSKLIQPSTYDEFFQLRYNRSFLKPIFYHSYPYRSYIGKKLLKIFYMPKYATFDVIAPFNLINYLEKSFLQLGGNRNYGHGIITLKDYIEIDISKLTMPTSATHAILVSPMIATTFPTFFEKYKYRIDKEILWDHGNKRQIDIIPPLQFFRLTPGSNIKRVAESGILRLNKFGHLGYGEFYLKEWNENE